jgi:histidyl-tRNA synthetase
MNREIIQPRTLAGFRDFLPESMIPREKLMETARNVFRSYGFAPIDTPALEILEILTGKGSEETDRQMYHFVDNGGRAVGMRFDLTVPLARFVAQHIEKLGTPFKRYHIGPVWRGERQQAGRYREFVQSDFDTIGSTSIASDVETAMVIYDLLRAIGFERFKIRINNRKLLNGLLDKFGLAGRATAVMRSVDKLEKAGREKVSAELQAAGAGEQQITRIIDLVATRGTNDQVLERLASLADGNELALSGLSELRELASLIEASGANPGNFQIDPSIARGLDYYTGVVFETILDDDPDIGSVCSGGRYDNLAGLYTTRQLPGIGASLGLDRMLAAMERLNLLPGIRTPADILIINFGREYLGAYLQMAREIRSAGYGVEIYPDPRKLGQQFKYADQRGHAVCLVAGGDELAGQRVQLKWMASGEQRDVPIDSGAKAVVAAMAAAGNSAAEFGKSGR